MNVNDPLAPGATSRPRLVSGLAVVLGLVMLVSLSGASHAGVRQVFPGHKNPHRDGGEDNGLKKGVFIVAEKSLTDPNFARTVILLTHYGATGSVGVIINRPTRMPLSQVLPDVKELGKRSDMLFSGGPVLRNALVLLLRSKEKLAESYHVFGDVYFTSSATALNEVLTNPRLDGAMRAYAGYAGWAPGQLEMEIVRGDWRVIDADSGSIFEKDPETIWSDIVDVRKRQLLIRLFEDEPAGTALF